MADKEWTPVEKLDWENDVGIVKELNAALKAMAEANSLETLLGYCERQRENTKYLMPAGRAKWEQAYARNVLRLTRPEALRPETVYVAVTAEAKGKGKYEYAAATVYDSFRAAVRMTISDLLLEGNLYRRMAADAVEKLKAAVEAEDWYVAYDVLRQQTRGLLVTILPQRVEGDDPARTFTLDPESGTVAGVWPYERVRHSTIEHRYGDGGKGGRGVYLVAERRELARMLQGAGEMTATEVQAIFNRIADRLEQDAAGGVEPAALTAWRLYADEMADEEDD